VKISCPSCSAKYSISDEKVVSRLAKIRCRKCGSTIVIDGKVNPPHVSASAGGDPADAHEQAADAGGTEFSVDLGEGDQRTMPLADIVAAYNAGQITGETFVWADGFADWKPLSDVQEIVDALHSAAGGGRGSQPQAAAEPGGSPWEAKAAAQPSPTRAAARPVRGASSDLFGRIERAGSEDEVATSAPDAAGGGSSGATGSRNESSVLFSLSALTSASASKPSAAGSRSSTSGLGGMGGGGASTSASREDSGLIDLKALTAAAVKADPGVGMGGGMAAPAMTPLAASPLGVASPLGLGAPIGGGGLGLGDLQAPQKSKTGLFVAIAIVAAAVIVALAVILRPPPPPVVVAPPPPPAPAAAPTPTPTPTLAATPPATGSAAEEEAPDKKKTATTVRRTSGGTRKSPTTTSSPPTGGGESTPAPPPKPKSNNCGCSPSDLNCNMRCRAKG
jgi:predicted Zn finger-like uncharacterized protein